jgi:transposase
MAASPRRPKPVLSPDQVIDLKRISSSRTEPSGRVQRAKVLLAFDSDEPIRSISVRLGLDRTTVHYTIDKACRMGPLAALDDLARPGRPSRITDEATAWVVSIACQKPVTLGFAEELWTLRLLTRYLKEHCEAAGYSCLRQVVPSTVHTILEEHEVQPHKINYYLERRDPDFDQKMVQVLTVYKEVSIWQSTGLPSHLSAVISYDEKPGMQAIQNTAPDLPPVPGRHPAIGRDHEYIRHGTVSLLAGINLMNGVVHGLVRERHRSLEFIEFLELINEAYAPQTKIRIVLDNHSAHVSRQLQEYLASKPNRFEFVFTPKHGSWLNLVEVFFAKMANTMLRGIRVESKQQLIRRIEQYLAEINKEPVIFRWTYKLDDIQII